MCWALYRSKYENGNSKLSQGMHMLAYYVIPIFSKKRVNASSLYLDIALPLNLQELACRIAGGPVCILRPAVDHIQMEL